MVDNQGGTLVGRKGVVKILAERGVALADQ